MGFVRGFKAEANRIALRVREQMALAPTAPIDPFAVCAFFDIEVTKLSQLPCNTVMFRGVGQASFSAVTVPCGLRTAIVHNDVHHPYRQRSNICHELAHCFLGHVHTPPLTAAGERIYNKGVEAEANVLGGCLLISNEAAMHIAAQGLQPVAQALYGVSKQMLDYRMKISGALVIQRRRLNRAA